MGIILRKAGAKTAAGTWTPGQQDPCIPLPGAGPWKPGKTGNWIQNGGGPAPGTYRLRVILAEGYKAGPFPRIAVCRREVSLALPCPEEELLAVVSDAPLPVRVPQFRFEDVPALCDRILDA